MSDNSLGRRPQHREQSASSIPEELLAHTQAGREAIQQFVPLASSLEWLLGKQYLQQRGNKAFLSDWSPVPYVVNNDGSLSRNAADVFFASLVAAEKDGNLDGDIVVLELGIGVGLFARYFLDRMRELSALKKKDYYDRLTYIAADNSERMLRDVLRHGVLAEHPGRYQVRRLDAMNPADLLTQDEALGKGKPTPLRAVFLNYLLDCLPAAVLEIEENKIRQLCVRTCVARNVNLAEFTELTPEQLRERAKSVRLPKSSETSEVSSDPKARDELLEVYGLFASEYDYQPVDTYKVPYYQLALEMGRTGARTFRSIVNSPSMPAKARSCRARPPLTGWRRVPSCFDRCMT